jgi:crotonobetainyl-CoA:carnitine CoA-transferase CaiB-like acyl-CoA transferase
MPHSSTKETRDRPLEDVTVLDLTTALAGPFGTLLLAGLGARVIKIENPLSVDSCRENPPYLGKSGATLVRWDADDVSVSAINRLRNKQAITLNLKKPKARGVFADLVRRADVIFENFSRGAMNRLGAGYAQAREINPRIVYCSLTGFGSEGEAGSGKAMDAIIQALSGFMMTSGAQGDPPVRVGVPVADMCAPLFAVIGVLAALMQARRAGVGQHVDVSMLGVMSMMVSGEPFDVLERLGIPQRTGLSVPRLSPFGTYRTRDGFVAICAPMEAFAKALFEAIGRPELNSDPRFSTRDQRVVHVNEVDRIIENYTQRFTAAEVIATLEAAGVPAAQVRNTDEAVRDPRVVARGETVKLSHPKYGEVDDVYGMGMPLKFSGARVGFDQPPPAVGEHNEAIYGGLLGYSAERIAELRRDGVI